MDSSDHPHTTNTVHVGTHNIFRWDPRGFMRYSRGAHIRWDPHISVCGAHNSVKWYFFV
jgi:hypothetical protein